MMKTFQEFGDGKVCVMNGEEVIAIHINRKHYDEIRQDAYANGIKDAAEIAAKSNTANGGWIQRLILQKLPPTSQTGGEV